MINDGSLYDLRLDESFCFILNWLDLQNSLCYSTEKSSSKKTECTYSTRILCIKGM
jgi:hypothetical protein